MQGRRVFVAAATVALAACSEDLDSGAACPALCPEEALATRDTVLQPIVLDTTLSGYPGLGLEGLLPLIARGDTVDTRVIVRFDSLPATFTPAGGAATPYTEITSATLVVRVDTAGTTVPGPFFVEAYDVGGAGVDTDAAALAQLFRPERRLGLASFVTRAALGDTLLVPIDPAVALARVQSAQPLRVGLLLRSAGSAQVSLASLDGLGGGGALLRLRTSGDTAAQLVTPSSRPATPAASSAPALRDFLAVVRGPGQPAPGQLAAGGVYGRRVLLQFALPPSILDSATVVRATLELTQAPNRAAGNRTGQVTAFLQPVTASVALADTLADGSLRDPGRVASFLCSPVEGTVLCPTTVIAGLAAQFRLQPVVRSPVDSGAVRVEVGSLIRLWQLPGTPAAARALVLRVPLNVATAFDAPQAGELLLYSKEAAPALRPRLVLTYVTRSSYALP